MKFLLFLCSFLICLFSLINKSNALYFEIKGDRERCFVDEFHKNTVLVVNYEIQGLDITQEASIFYN